MPWATWDFAGWPVVAIALGMVAGLALLGILVWWDWYHHNRPK